MPGGAPLINDRKLGANVRRRLLKEVEKILDSGNKTDIKEIVFKMCNTHLPRLTEISGRGGESLKITFDQAFSAVASQTTDDSGEEGAVQDSPSGQEIGEDDA